MDQKPQNIDLQGIVKEVVDTGKRFKSGGIDRHKYMLHLEDGYTAEYCLPLLTKMELKKGDRITYRIVMRVPQGDTVNVISYTRPEVPGETKLPPQTSLGIGTSSMQGHPACVALTVAAQMGVRHGWEMDLVFLKAEECMKWLLDRKDLAQYNF